MYNLQLLVLSFVGSKKLISSAPKKTSLREAVKVNHTHEINIIIEDEAPLSW